MKHFIFAVILAAFTASAALGQSLKVNSPAPLQAGVNASNTDNFTGTHYWYFYVNPGKVTITVKYNNGTVLGAPTNATMTFTFSNADGDHSSIVLGRGENEKTFTAVVKKRHKMLLAVVPPQGGLVRLGGDYSVEVTGAVAFGQQKSGDPIVGTYTQMAGMTSNYGACKFKADGTILASTGATGTWKLFDADSHTYVIVLDGQRLSLVLRPGRGLTDPSDPSAVDFQAVR